MRTKFPLTLELGWHFNSPLRVADKTGLRSLADWLRAREAQAREAKRAAMLNMGGGKP